jgi:hypothetical protein
MYQAFEATIDQAGVVHLVGYAQLPAMRRALVIVLNEPSETPKDDTALLSEEALAESWNRPEEDAAWAYLQSEK